jgi:hypothetical protein
MDLGKMGWDCVDWIRLVWLRIGTSGDILWMRWWTFGLYKMLGNYWVATQPVASRVVLSSIELVRERINCECLTTCLEQLDIHCCMKCDRKQY